MQQLESDVRLFNFERIVHGTETEGNGGK